LCLNAYLAIVIAFDKFFASYDTTANTAPNLRKKPESSGLPVSGRNLSFFRNVLNYLTSGISESLNCPEEIAS